MQSSSRSRPFKSGLIGASPITDAKLSRCNEFLHAALRRRRFVVQVHVRAPCSKSEIANLKSKIYHGDHDVIAASRPVKAFVPVQIRLVTPISMGRSCSLSSTIRRG